MASGKIMSAPASTQAQARSMADWKALHRQSVGAGHDDKVIPGRVRRRLDPVHHLRLGDDGLAGPVAAALGLDLVLDVAAGGASAHQFPHGALDVEGAGAQASVGIHQQGGLGDIGDAAHVLADVVQVADPQVRQAQGARRDAAAGEVEGAVADALGHHGVVGIDGADDLQGLFRADGLAQAGAGGLGWGHGGSHGSLINGSKGSVAAIRR
jgi:hypothetical protein